MIVARVRRVGGGFGGKETRAVPVACAAAVAAFRTKRPVRLVLDRDVDMPIHGTRHPFFARYRAGFTREGRLVSYDVELFSNGGHSPDLSVPVLHRALFHVDNTYLVPNLRCRGTVCKTNRPSNTAFRGFGGPQGLIVIETALDRMAAMLHKDPATLRELNMYNEGDQTHYLKPLVNCTARRVWTELMQTSEYTRRKAEAAVFNRSSRFKKRGLAVVPVKFGLSFTHAPLNQAGALVHVYTDGSVLVSHGACEIGQGVSTKMAQIAATALRIPVDLVRVGDTSTDKVPNTSATAASVQADLNGMAVLDACTQIRTRLDKFTATLTSPPEWKELVHMAYEARVDLSAHGFFAAEYGYNWKTNEGKVFAYYTYGAACSEVEVDVLTGEHVVLRSDVVMDLGQSMNPAIDVGQVEGAFVQGIGWCTTEQIVVFSGSGSQFTKGPGTYKVPGPGDVPFDFRVRLLSDSHNPFAVHSSKGVGEPPFYLGTSVFFAIKDAVASARADVGIQGFFQLSLPATVERIRMACRDAFTDPPGISGLAGCFVEEYPATEDILIPV
jgi:xanthine dehydrogenase/oxidase